MKVGKDRRTIILGVLAVLLIALIGLATVNWERLPVVGLGPEYTAEFGEAAGLKDGDEVRIAGIKVGEVTDVALAGDRVSVTFRAKGAWIGDQSTAQIKIKTVLGQKYVAIDPLGSAELDRETPIPLARTVTPYDVSDAFGDLAKATDEIDTDLLGEAFTTLADTFGASAPDDVQAAFDGLAALSKVISERDTDLRKLYDNTHRVSKTFAESNDELEALISDGGTLFAELNKRRDGIKKLLSGTRQMSRQLSGLVADNADRLGPALAQLEKVADVLERNQRNLDESLRMAGPFYRVVGNAVGNGPWVDGYVCGLISGGGDGCMPPKRTEGR